LLLKALLAGNVSTIVFKAKENNKNMAAMSLPLLL